MRRVARVENGLVVNVETATDEWIASMANDPSVVLDSETAPACIGLSWSAETGFEQPPRPPVESQGRN